jgi:hypothetical protein
LRALVRPQSLILRHSGELLATYGTLDDVSGSTPRPGCSRAPTDTDRERTPRRSGIALRCRRDSQVRWRDLDNIARHESLTGDPHSRKVRATGALWLPSQSREVHSDVIYSRHKDITAGARHHTSIRIATVRPLVRWSFVGLADRIGQCLPKKTRITGRGGPCGLDRQHDLLAYLQRGHTPRLRVGLNQDHVVYIVGRPPQRILDADEFKKLGP